MRALSVLRWPRAIFFRPYCSVMLYALDTPSPLVQVGRRPPYHRVISTVFREELSYPGTSELRVLAPMK